MHPRLLLLLAFFLAAFTGIASAQTDSMVSAVNTAGEQRMLSQRIVKLYCQIGLNVMPALAATQLRDASSRFENNLLALQSVAQGSPRARPALDRLRRDWTGMKNAATQAVSREAAMALSQRAEATLASAEQLTGIIEKEGRSPADHWVNLAGRQRMLSQRIASTYLLLSWGEDSPALRQRLSAAVKEFSAGLARLQDRPDNSEALRTEINEVAQQWEWLKTSLSLEGAGSYRLIVAEAAESILEGTIRITQLYETQSRP